MKYNLSEITDLIRNRRTIFPEQYSSRKVHKEQVELILNNAIWAPTHGKTQPWKFHVFMEDGLQRLSDFLGKTYLEITPKEEQNDMKLAKLVARPLRSSVVIAVSLDRQPTSKINELEEIEAIACAIQNMSLTCTAYGLGSFWATPKLIYSDEMKNFLGLKSEDKCLSLFFIGYPEGEWPKAQRRPIEYSTNWVTE
ncbi:MAG TPA: nitroreductase [Taishania sp.]|nr:nitroreductase [Taishania sp.]HNS42382.1 nitroreductase [Taishania sp.]